MPAITYMTVDDPTVKLRLAVALVVVGVQRVLDLAPPYLLAMAVDDLTPPNKVCLVCKS